MAKYRVTSPSGEAFEVNAPEGASEADVMAYAKAEFAKQAPAITKPAAVEVGDALRAIPRQLGLTARYGAEGLAQAAQIGTEPLRLLTDRVLGGEGKSRPLSSVVADLADWVGLPKPEGANERVVGDAARLVAGAGGLGAVGRVAQAAPGVSRMAGDLFANNMGRQALSAGGAGLAGGSTREAGGGEVAQALSALAGGVALPMAAGGAQSLANMARAKFAPQALQQVDQQISLVLREQGIDWSQIPERIRQPMRAEVAQALNTGGNLNPDALRRMIDFKAVGATPTRGMLTQDPVQITREMNLAKTGANSTDLGLQRLPGLQNENTATLLRALDEAGAKGAPDAFQAGQGMLGALRSNAAASKARIDTLYAAARDTAGRSAPLDGAAFASRANQALDEALLGGKLPGDVAAHMNRIARGEVPFDVNYAEQLKTRIGDLQRGESDKSVRKALGLVRGALDDTPLRSAPAVNPGNLPAVPGTVPPSPGVLGEESIAAFNRARAANRAFRQRVEGTPALQAALDGAEPDRFVQQFVIGSGSTVKDVAALRRAVAQDPSAMQQVKGYIVSHLKSAATNGTEDVTKFSPSAYNKALNQIGERKLSAFFAPEEIQQLRAVGRVGTLMTSQPAGSAVNNSNSGALLLGRGLDMLGSVAGKLPLGLNTTIEGLLRGTQQAQALRTPPALLLPAPNPGLLQSLAAPVMYGGLLATQPVNQR
ncbi:MAG: hypothetical protein RJA55_2316 [Acidobacteriota bacterium]|jgi:hypothetical protein